MRTNIREMPSCLENIKNLFWPHLNRLCVWIPASIFLVCGGRPDSQEGWQQEAGSCSEKQLLAPGCHEERGEAKAPSQQANTQDGLTRCQNMGMLPS